MTDDLAIKSVETALAASVQPRARQEGTWGGVQLLSFLAQGAGLIAPWWSKRRDVDLARFWPQCSHLAGAYYTLQSKLTAVPFRIEPRDPAVKAHRDMAEYYQGVLEEESEFGQGWQTLWGMALQDLWQYDNGFFLEVIGDGNKAGPIRGPALGLAHLDASRCQRTGNIQYPVVYQATDGSYYQLHRSRVIFRSQMSSGCEGMNGVGLCWTSRIVDAAQNLVDIARYKQEKLGSRPQRGIIVTQGGLDPDVLAEAFRQSEHLQDAWGLTRFSKFVVVGDPSYPDATLQMVDLASLPDGFDEDTSTTLAMYTIALTGAVPPRWLWPATTNGATKADAMYQHVAGLTGGPGATLKMIATALGGSERGKVSLTGQFLPPTLKMSFDFQDDEQDRDQADIRDKRSQTREREVNDGVISVRVAREQAAESGDLTVSQFEELELQDDRLPDGEPVLTLFHSRDGQMQGLLAVDAIGEPLDVAANDAAEWTAATQKQIQLDTDVMVNAPNAALKRKARQAIAALEALAELYTPKPEPPAPPPVEEAPPASGAETPEEAPAEGEPEPQEDETDEAPFAEEKAGGEDAYGAAIRAAVRGLWIGTLDKMDFVDSMLASFSRRLSTAWYRGAAECGIKPDELSDEEKAALQELIGAQMQYVYGFADAIIAGSKANGGKLAPLLDRAEMWSSRYQDAYTRARAMACGDKKGAWRLGQTEVHCQSCLKLNGKVKRMSTWLATVLPGNPPNASIACGGWKCDCGIEETDEPLSRGPLPRLP